MKKLLFLTVAVLLLGFSMLAAQKPDSVYLLGAVNGPIDAAAPDLDNDGNPDLVFITENGDSIVTMLGNGSGTFSNRTALGVVSGANQMVAIDVADFNNDGNVDVVAASLGTTNVLVFSGVGNGTLTFFGSAGGPPAIDVVTGNFDSYSPLNLNADFALLLRESGTDSILYYFGVGNGFFTGLTKASAGGDGGFLMTKQTEPGSVPALEHIAVANFGSGNIGLVISNGNRTFATTTITARAASPGGVAWDFFNNDNLLDLAHNGYTNDSLFVQIGTGLTTYNAAVSYPLRSNPFGMASGDFTGDGHIDLVSTNLGNDSLSFYVNNGAGGFLPIINSYLGFNDRRPRAWDINNNGVPDVLVSAAGGNFFGVFNLKSPSVTPSIIAGNPPAGSPFTLPVMTASDSTNIASVKFVYRQMGKTAYDTLTMTPGAGTATQRDYTGTLPAAAMTNRGLEYFIRTSDGFVTANQPFDRFIRLSTSIAQNAPATPDRSYQMVSFPMRFNPVSNGSASIQIGDDFSLTDPNVARLFWWDPVKADTITTDTTSLKGYREFPFPGLTNFYFEPGRSMFLATVGSKVYDAVGLSNQANAFHWRPTPLGDSVLVEYFFTDPLDSGWNMIATPFPYTVHLDSVDVFVFAVDPDLHEVTDPVRDNRIGLGGANLRERTSSGYIVPNPPLLKPWRGYFLKNNGPEQVIMLYPKLDGSFPLTAPPAPKAYAAGLDWKIDLIAKSGEIETPPTTLGTSKAALREYDQLDWELPPGLAGDLRVVFEKGKEFGLAADYLTDIRPTLTESESWIFTVAPGGARAIELNFDGLAEVPADYDLILTDKEGRAKQNLRLEPVYRFIASQDRHFELTVAPKTTGQTALLPTKYDLHQNFPNPFNPQTLIKYDLPEAAAVRLEVFNILGQKVATLVNHFETAGPKSVVWDGTDGRGAKVSSGIYFYKIAAGDFLATKKMMLVK